MSLTELVLLQGTAGIGVFSLIPVVIVSVSSVWCTLQVHPTDMVLLLAASQAMVTSSYVYAVHAEQQGASVTYIWSSTQPPGVLQVQFFVYDTFVAADVHPVQLPLASNSPPLNVYALAITVALRALQATSTSVYDVNGFGGQSGHCEHTCQHSSLSLNPSYIAVKVNLLSAAVVTWHSYVCDVALRYWLTSCVLSLTMFMFSWL
jgi:hypothetical protein